MKKFLALMFSISLIFSMLSSCSSPDSVNKDGIEKVETGSEKELEQTIEESAESVADILAEVPEHLTRKLENGVCYADIDADIIINSNKLYTGRIVKKGGYDLNAVAKACFGESASEMVEYKSEGEDSIYYSLKDTDNLLYTVFEADARFPQVDGEDLIEQFSIQDSKIFYLNLFLDGKYSNEVYYEGEQAPNSEINSEEALAIANKFIDDIGGDSSKWIAEVFPCGQKNGGKGFYQICFNYNVEGVPVEVESYITNDIYVTDEGILRVYGDFLIQEENIQELSKIIEFETMLAIAEEQFMDKLAHGVKDIERFSELRIIQKEIIEVRLEYYTNGNEFRPVWRFVDKDNYKLGTQRQFNFYVDAQNGEVTASW